MEDLLHGLPKALADLAVFGCIDRGGVVLAGEVCGRLDILNARFSAVEHFEALSCKMTNTNVCSWRASVAEV